MSENRTSIVSFTLVKANYMAKANISRVRKCFLPLVGGAAKSYGKRHEYREERRIRGNYIVYSSGHQGG